MSDAPERIWAWQYNDHETGGKHDCGEWYVEDHGLDGDEVEYRRADLPATDEECLRNEKVRALVGLLKDARSDLACHIDHDYPEVTRAQYPDTHRRWKRDMELCWKIDAALAALQEVKDDH